MEVRFMLMHQRTQLTKQRSERTNEIKTISEREQRVIHCADVNVHNDVVVFAVTSEPRYRAAALVAGANTNSYNNALVIAPQQKKLVKLINKHIHVC